MIEQVANKVSEPLTRWKIGLNEAVGSAKLKIVRFVRIAKCEPPRLAAAHDRQQSCRSRFFLVGSDRSCFMIW